MSTTTSATTRPTGTITPNPDSPEALMVGDPDFMPGTYYKDKPVLAFREKDDEVVLGTWWWYLHRIVEPDDEGISVDMALDMLIANNVSEIYLDIGAMVPWAEEVAQGGLTEADSENDLVSERYVRGFVKKCNQYGIRVAALGGASGPSVLQWIDPQYQYRYMKDMVEKVANYQANAAEDERFYAIHLDVEPHTEESYGENRAKYNQWVADLVIATREECDRIGLELEWDIWAWITEEDMVTDQYGQSVNLLEVYTRECHALGIMAYTNTGIAQFERGTDVELSYAKKNNCRLIIASEMSKISPMNTTYYYSPRETAIAEQQILRQKIDECGYANMGGAIHHLASFYQYMTK